MNADLMREIKVAAAITDKSMKQYIAEAVREKIDKEGLRGRVNACINTQIQGS